MKNKFLIPILALSLFLVPIKKSNAGIIIVASGTASGASLVVGYSMIGLGAAGVTKAVVDNIEYNGGLEAVVSTLFLGVPGAVLLILDADASLPTAELSNHLIQKYPFLDDQNIAIELAQLIKDKAGIILENESKLVSLTKEEILSVLAPLDVSSTESEVVKLIKDLE